MKTKQKSKRQRQEQMRKLKKRSRLTELDPDIVHLVQKSSSVLFHQSGSDIYQKNSGPSTKQDRSLCKNEADQVPVTKINTSHEKNEAGKVPVTKWDILQGKSGSHLVPVNNKRDGSHKAKAADPVPVTKWDGSHETNAPNSVPVSKRDASIEIIAGAPVPVTKRDSLCNQSRAPPVTVTTQDRSYEINAANSDTKVSRSDNNTAHSVPACNKGSSHNNKRAKLVPGAKKDKLYGKSATHSVTKIQLIETERLLENINGVSEREDHNSICMLRYPWLLEISHPDNLPNHVLYGELPIEILDLSSVLLKHQFSLKHGLILPSCIYAHILEGNQLCDAECIPSDCAAVQMHFVPGHYILSYQFMETITIYDSSPIAGRIDQLLPQLKLVYRILTENPETPIFYCTPHQPDSESCGMFVIAFAVALLLKQIPLQNKRFLEQNMRGHLLKCLTQSYFTVFPTLPDEMQSLQNYLESQAEYQENLNRSKENSEGKLRPEKSFNMILNNKIRKARQRKGLTRKQIVKENAEAKERMGRYRKSLSSEHQAQIQKMDKSRKRDWRDSLTASTDTENG